MCEYGATYLKVHVNDARRQPQQLAEVLHNVVRGIRVFLEELLQHIFLVFGEPSAIRSCARRRRRQIGRIGAGVERRFKDLKVSDWLDHHRFWEVQLLLLEQWWLWLLLCG